jgi:hypothetical protein
MSTYLSEAPTYLPTIQPYQPDMQLYAGTLNMKQTQYDTAHKELSSLYGSLLNSPMMRDSNIQTRDEFFKTIDYEIKKVANLDLSLKENQHQASRLFTSLYQDKNIVKDMMWTKNFQNEQNRAENFRNCFNPEDCGGAQYWDEGMMAMEYRAQEFQNATDEDAMNFGDVSYVPYINFAKLAAEVAKESGLVNQTLEVPDNQGYIVKTHNGPDLVQGLLTDYFLEYFERDPRLKDMYKTMAYVERKNWVSQNTEKYGSEQAATQAYVAEKQQIIDDTFASMKEVNDYNRSNNQKKKDKLEKQIEEEGTSGTDSLAKAYMQVLDDEARANQTGTLIESTLNASGSVNNARDIMRAAEAMDYSWSSVLLRDDIYTAAYRNSFIDYEVSYKPDSTWVAKNIRTGSGDDDEEEISPMDLLSKSTGIFITEAKEGDKVIDPTDEAAANVLIDEITKKENQLAGAGAGVSAKLFDVTRDASASGDPQAQADLIRVGQSIINNYASYADRQNDPAVLKKSAELLKQWNEKSPEAKAKWLEGGALNEVNASMDEQAYRNVYKATYGPMANNAMINPSRAYMKPYLEDVDAQLQYLKDENVFLQTQRDLNMTFMREAAEKARTDNMGGPMEEFIPFVVGNDGKFRNSNQTAVAYAMAKNSGAATVGEPTMGVTGYPLVGMQQLPFMQDREIMLVRDVEGVGKAGDKKVYKESQMPNSRLNIAKQLAFATGNDIYAKRAVVKFKDAEGKQKTVGVKDFFDDNGSVKPKYAQYARSFDFGDNDNSKQWEADFRKTKAAYKFGDKKDAWEKGSDGTWRFNPDKERTTWFGRTMRDYVLPSMNRQLAASWQKNRINASLEYYLENTNYDADEPEDYYARGKGWKLEETALAREVKLALPKVKIQGLGWSQVSADFGSLQGKTMNGVVHQFNWLDPASGGLSESFAAYKFFTDAAFDSGFDEGGSRVSFTPNISTFDDDGKTVPSMSDVKHEDKALAFFQVLQSMAFDSTAKKGESKIKLSWEYSGIARNDESWSALTVKPIIDPEAMKLVESQIKAINLTYTQAKQYNKEVDIEELAGTFSDETLQLINASGLTVGELTGFLSKGVTIYSPDAVQSFR